MEARCPTHPSVFATLACERCGTFACPRCSVTLLPVRWEQFTRHVCASCLEIVRAELEKKLTRPSLRASIVFYGGWALGFSPVAPVITVLAVMELLAIRAGTAPLAGRGWTLTGLAFSVVCFGLFVALVASGALSRSPLFP